MVNNYANVYFKELKDYLQTHPGGKEIISFYKEQKTLDDANRKRLVNIVVDHMLQFMPEGILPSNETKIQYAKCITTLFPKLENKHGCLGYVSIFYSYRYLSFATRFYFIL